MSLGKTRWIAAGRPEHGIMVPILDLKAALVRHGYTVGTVGDDAHLNAAVAEDHTWFSQTGWPAAALLGWEYAADIMAPPAGSGLPSLVALGEQISADWGAGVPGTEWIKYMNWTHADGRCVHEARDPSHRIVDSGDRGHIHISGRTDYLRSTVAAGYDPVLRRLGGTLPPAAAPLDEGYPAFAGRDMVLRKPRMHGSDVLAGQHRFQARGWVITADGWYGPRTEDVVARFQRDSTRHSWPLVTDGRLGPKTWRALWLRPVS